MGVETGLTFLGLIWQQIPKTLKECIPFDLLVLLGFYPKELKI